MLKTFSQSFLLDADFVIVAWFLESKKKMLLHHYTKFRVEKSFFFWICINFNYAQVPRLIFIGKNKQIRLQSGSKISVFKAKPKENANASKTSERKAQENGLVKSCSLKKRSKSFSIH